MLIGHAGGQLYVQFRYDKNVISRLKDLPAYKWDKDQRCWWVPLEFLPMIYEMFPDATIMDECYRRYAALERAYTASRAVETDKVDTGLPGGQLYPFQAAGVRYIEGKGGRALLADEMGLGKTVQVLAYVFNDVEKRTPLLVVTMATIKQHIADMVVKWLGWPEGAIKILSGQKPESNLPKTEGVRVYIINYDIAQYWEKFLYTTKYKTFMIDESQMIKNAKTKRAEVCRRLADFSEGVIAASGTPVETSPIDIHNQVVTVRPDTFTSWWQFANRYNPKTGYMDTYQPANLQELEQRLRMLLMVRRTKAQVAPWLPEVERVPIKLGINLDAYAEAVKRLKAAMAHPGFAGLTIEDITEMRQEAARAKLPAMVEWAQDVSTNGKPIVLFGHHHEITDEVSRQLEAPILDGRTSQKRKNEIIKYFQLGQIPVLIGGTRAMGLGIELFASSVCATMEFDWNMTKHGQAEARFHRIEPPNPLTSYYFVGMGTLDERMMSQLGSKQSISETVLGQEKPDKLIIAEVLKELEQDA